MADFSKPVNPTEAEIQKFLSRVDKNASPNGCWLWTRGKSGEYGEYFFRTEKCLTHRISWALFRGVIPKDTPFVLHNCPGGDNKICVNPDHLRLGTAADNSADAIIKGQVATGDRHRSRTSPETLSRGDSNGMRKHPESVQRGVLADNHKLDDEMVRDIKLRLASGTRGIGAVLAREYGVSKTKISHINHGKAWNHVV